MVRKRRKRFHGKISHRASLLYVRSDKRIHTNDNWHPTLDGMVMVSALLCTHVWGVPAVRVCVWGGDDYGAERDWHLKSEEQALELYRYWVRRISGWTYLTVPMLDEMGFGPG